MGAENSILEGGDWGDPLTYPPGIAWKLIPVTKSDGTEVMVYQTKNADKKDSHLLKKGSVLLKSLRHPNIVRFLGCGEGSEGFWLATESVRPLLSLFPSVSCQEVSAGLLDLLQALDFMHSKLSMSHNNICMSSVYVSSDGVWKLGGLEHACKFSDATAENLDKSRAFRCEDSLAPEEKAGMVKVDGAIGHARDVYSLGSLVDTILDSMNEKDDVSHELEQDFSVCLNSDPLARPQVNTLLKLPVFRSPFSEIVHFLRHVTVKSQDQKVAFFSTLLPKLRSLPECVLARRLVVPLLSRFVLLDATAVEMVIPELLTPKSDSTPFPESSEPTKGLLGASLFQQHVIPQVYNIFHVHDCHIRLVLLQHFSRYAHLFSREQLNNDIFLQVLLGVRDCDDRIVAASLRAVADLVPILGGDAVIGGRRKAFFFHGLPKQATSSDVKGSELPKDVTSVLPSHKPLLKDLATGGRQSVLLSTHVDREKKARERERRREEARLKREERKKKLKEAKEVEEDERKDSNHIPSEPQKVTLTIEEMAELDDRDDSELKSKVEQEDSVETAEHDQDGLKDIGTGNWNDAGSGDEEKQAPDWSDWEDADGNISDEIEEELRNMPSVVETSGSKIQTSPSPYRSQLSPPSPPPVSVDWSDVPEADREMSPYAPSKKGVRGPLELGRISSEANHVSAEGANDSTSNSNTSSMEDWNSGELGNVGLNPVDLNQSSLRTEDYVVSSSGSPPTRKSLKLKVSASSAKTRPKKNAIANDLGFGYDIKSIEIQSKSSPLEADFFADMAPTIPQAKPNSLLRLGEPQPSLEDETSAGAGETDSKRPKDEKMFAVVLVGDEEVTGWGDDDDLDWGSSF